MGMLEQTNAGWWFCTECLVATAGESPDQLFHRISCSLSESTRTHISVSLDRNPNHSQMLRMIKCAGKVDRKIAWIVS